MLESLYHILRMAVRSLIRRPFYSGMAITILTLGLAASSTVVNYINSFFRPFPGINADRLVQIYGVERDNPYTSVSYLDYVDYAAGARGAPMVNPTVLLSIWKPTFYMNTRRPVVLRIPRNHISRTMSMISKSHC